MKVGIVCPYDWSFPGGVRTHILGLAAALDRRGVQSEIITPASLPLSGVYAVGGTVGIPWNGSIGRICFSRSAKRRLDERLARGDLDLLHVHEPAIPSISLFASMSRRMRVVATFHAGAARSLGYLLARPFLRYVLDRIDVRIAVSEAARSLVARYFPGDYRVVPNGVELARFAAAAPAPELDRLRPFVLFVGRDERRKGFEVAWRAVEIARKRLDLRLVAVGVLRRPADWVIPLGLLGDDRLPGIYAAADVFCAPSLGRESFGLVQVEAMAAGTPVVCSDIPGYREAAGDAALLVPPGDPAKLAGGLLQVLGNPGLARELKDRGKRRAAAFDWNLVVERVIECYLRAAAGRSRHTG